MPENINKHTYKNSIKNKATILVTYTDKILLVIFLLLIIYIFFANYTLLCNNNLFPYINPAKNAVINRIQEKLERKFYYKKYVFIINYYNDNKCANFLSKIKIKIVNIKNLNNTSPFKFYEIHVERKNINQTKIRFTVTFKGIWNKIHDFNNEISKYIENKLELSNIDNSCSNITHYNIITESELNSVFYNYSYNYCLDSYNVLIKNIQDKEAKSCIDLYLKDNFLYNCTNQLYNDLTQEYKNINSYYILYFLYTYLAYPRNIIYYVIIIIICSTIFVSLYDSILLHNFDRTILYLNYITNFDEEFKEISEQLTRLYAAITNFRDDIIKNIKKNFSNIEKNLENINRNFQECYSRIKKSGELKYLEKQSYLLFLESTIRNFEDIKLMLYSYNNELTTTTKHSRIIDDLKKSLSGKIYYLNKYIKDIIYDLEKQSKVKEEILSVMPNKLFLLLLIFSITILLFFAKNIIVELLNIAQCVQCNALFVYNFYMLLFLVSNYILSPAIFYILTTYVTITNIDKNLGIEIPHRNNMVFSARNILITAVLFLLSYIISLLIVLMILSLTSGINIFAYG